MVRVKGKLGNKNGKNWKVGKEREPALLEKMRNTWTGLGQKLNGFFWRVLFKEWAKVKVWECITLGCWVGSYSTLSLSDGTREPQSRTASLRKVDSIHSAGRDTAARTVLGGDENQDNPEQTMERKDVAELPPWDSGAPVSGLSS